MELCYKPSSARGYCSTALNQCMLKPQNPGWPQWSFKMADPNSRFMKKVDKVVQKK